MISDCSLAPCFVTGMRVVGARVVLVLVCVLILGVGGPAGATARTDSDVAPARIDHITTVTDRWLQVFVDSPAMGRIVQVDVLLPAMTSAPRPTVYLLDGISSVRAGESDWTYQGGAVRFFADKNVNVVLPVGAPGSYYTNWLADDPVLGRQRWETLLSSELPPLFDAQFSGNGTNAVIGVSMGAQSALMLAERGGGLFRGVAAFSGCYHTSDLVGQSQIRFVVASVGGTPEDMWGGFDNPQWIDHDVLLHASALRGKAVYISAGSGISGPHENLDTPDLANRVVSGGALEASVHYCTVGLEDRLRVLGVSATFVYTAGTHSWPYWADQLAESWPHLVDALGL